MTDFFTKVTVASLIWGTILMLVYAAFYQVRPRDHLPPPWRPYAGKIGIGLLILGTVTWLMK